MIRSRSRWNSVRTGDDASGTSRPRDWALLAAWGERLSSRSSRRLRTSLRSIGQLILAYAAPFRELNVALIAKHPTPPAKIAGETHPEAPNPSTAPRSAQDGLRGSALLYSPLFGEASLCSRIRHSQPETPGTQHSAGETGG